MAATTKFGTKAPIKKMFGTKEVLKEVLNGVTVYTNTPPVQPYLTFSSPNTFTIATSNSTKNWDGTLYYSTDAENWSTWSGTTAINSSSTGDVKYLYIRGSGNHVIGGMATGTRWTLTGSDISCTGNIENLLDYQDVENGIHPTMADNCFMNLFRNCVALISSPEILAETLSTYCYGNMFMGCSNLLTAPSILPATTLTTACYSGMFYGCTKLTNTPVISATNLSDYCCSTMFYNCQSITTAPILHATTMKANCYYNMFGECKALTTPPALSAITLANNCYYGMFYGCINMTALPALPAANIPDGAYNTMFYNCSKIKISSIQTLEYQTSYRIPTSATGSYASSGSVANMFTNTGGTFTSNPSVNTNYYTSNEIVY